MAFDFKDAAGEDIAAGPIVGVSPTAYAALEAATAPDTVHVYGHLDGQPVVGVLIGGTVFVPVAVE